MHTFTPYKDTAERAKAKREGTFQEDSFRIGYKKFIVCHAPDGGRKEFGGPICQEPFAWVSPQAAIIDGRPKRQVPELSWGDLIEIEGYGLYHIEKPNARKLDGDHPRLRPIGAAEAIRMVDSQWQAA